MNKIYTNEGFIFFSSLDPYYSVGQQLINTVDSKGLSSGEQPVIDYNTIKPYTYSMGTPSKQIPLIFFLLSLQHFALTVGGIALMVLIFPVRIQSP